MRIEDLRIGNYVDVVLKENNTTIRCKVQRINHDDKSAVKISKSCCYTS